MEAFTSEVYEDLMSLLEKIEQEQKNMLRKSEDSYGAVKESLEKISSFMIRYNFSDKEEEVFYFKITKPKFLRELIYYAELYHLEAGKPAAGKKAAAHYYNRAMMQIRLYFERNQDFYNYWRSGKTYLDEIYFMRQPSSPDGLPPEYAADKDPSGYSTYYSFKLAKIQAFEKLKLYIEGPIQNKKIKQVQKFLANNNIDDGQPDLRWTDSKSGLIELIYALHAKGAINYGNNDLKKLMATFEGLFNLHLGNYYGVFQQNIRIRKKNRTQYIDQLKDRLEMFMDKEDENPKYARHDFK